MSNTNYLISKNNRDIPTAFDSNTKINKFRDKEFRALVPRSIDMRTCKQCLKEFQPESHDKSTFCTKACMDAWYSKQSVPEDALAPEDTSVSQLKPLSMRDLYAAPILPDNRRVYLK